MPSIVTVIPKADALLTLSIEDLGVILLKLAAEKVQSAGFQHAGVTEIPIGADTSGYPP